VRDTIRGKEMVGWMRRPVCVGVVPLLLLAVIYASVSARSARVSGSAAGGDDLAGQAVGQVTRTLPAAAVALVHAVRLGWAMGAEEKRDSGSRKGSGAGNGKERRTDSASLVNPPGHSSWPRRTVWMARVALVNASASRTRLCLLHAMRAVMPASAHAHAAAGAASVCGAPAVDGSGHHRGR